LRPSVAARLHKGSISGSAEGAGELGSRRVSNWSPQRIYAYVGLGRLAGERAIGFEPVQDFNGRSVKPRNSPRRRAP